MYKVVTYTEYYYKIYHEVESEEMAREYVAKILERGDFFSKGGLTTFIPASKVMKVVIVSPEYEEVECRTYTRPSVIRG